MRWEQEVENGRWESCSWPGPARIPDLEDGLVGYTLKGAPVFKDSDDGRVYFQNSDGDWKRVPLSSVRKSPPPVKSRSRPRRAAMDFRPVFEDPDDDLSY